MLPEDMRNLIGVVPFAFLIALLFILIFAFILSRTPFGQHTYAIGGNIDAARRAGIPVDRHLIKVYMISSFFASLSGVLATLIFFYWSSYPVCFKSGAFCRRCGSNWRSQSNGGKRFHVGNLSGSIGAIGLRNWLSYERNFTFYRYVAVGVTLIIAVLIDQSFPELVYD